LVFVVILVVSSNVDCRAVDDGVMAEFNFEHVMMCTDFEGEWKETAAGINSTIEERHASLHILYCLLPYGCFLSGEMNN
jgi:hypothetical protein